jgi:hypothetical protein
MAKIDRAGAGIFDKPEPEPELDKNGPAPHHCLALSKKKLSHHFSLLSLFVVLS